MYQFILHLCMHVCTFSAYGSELIFTAAIETTVQLSQNKTSRFLVHEIALVSHSFGFTQLSTIHLQLGVAISCFFMQMQHVGYLCQEMKTVATDGDYPPPLSSRLVEIHVPHITFMGAILHNNSYVNRSNRGH